MKGRSVAGIAGFLICGWLVMAATEARATLDFGPVQVTGTYQLVTDFNMGDTNPNNLGLTNRPGDPLLNLLQNFVDLTVFYKSSENTGFFFEPRLWHDLTKSADDHYIQYESMPANFRGDGYMLRAGGNDMKVEMWQSYFNYHAGNLFLRIGKQNVAWGNDLALRVLDQVDALDLSQVFFFGRGFEEFSQTRIPEWMALAEYQIPNTIVPDLSLEAFVSPGTWTPTILPSQGAPFSVLPSIFDFRDSVQMGRPIYGTRLSGTYGTVNFTLNFLSRPYANGVVIPGKLIFESPSQLPGNFCPPCFRLKAFGEHPRFFMYGGSVDYPWDWAGAVLRAETAVTSNVPFTYTTGASIITRPQIQQFFSIDRPTYIVPGLDSLFINMQFEEIYTAGSLHHVTQNNATGANITSAQQFVTVFFQQPLFQKRIDLEFLSVIDTADGKWFQPGVHWQIGDNYQLDLYYNTFSGSKSSRFPAQFWWADAAWLRFTYQF